jgi:hypothetical protein
VFAIQGTLITIVTVVVFAIQAWAFVDAVSHSPQAYVAAGKLTKPAWLIILGIALAAHMLIWSPLSILNLVGTVAAIVYLVDARPVLRSLSRRR